MTVTAERTRRIHMLGDPTWDPGNYAYFDEFDAYPEAGSYMGPPDGITMTLTDYEGTAHTVWGTNPLNAEDNFLKGLLAKSPTSEWDDRGQCDHCGAHIRYTIVMYHTPTGDYMAIGQDCATERFNQPDRVSYLRKRAEGFRIAAKERAERDARLAAFGAEHPGLLDFFQAYGAEHESGVTHWSDDFVLDVGRKLMKYGSISDRQIEAVGQAFTRDGEKERERLVAALDETPKTPAPTGRVTFSGKLVSERFYDGDYGSYTKILVVTDAGYKVWLTKPTGLGLAEIGDIVSITATLEPKESDPDPYFAIGKRPSKAFIVRAGS